LLFEMVGFCVMLQQTPRVVTDVPASEEIVPPDTAEFSVISLAMVVVTTGNNSDLSFKQEVKERIEQISRKE